MAETQVSTTDTIVGTVEYPMNKKVDISTVGSSPTYPPTKYRIIVAFNENADGRVDCLDTHRISGQ